MTRKSEHLSRSARGSDESRLQDLEALFTANLDLIRRVVRSIASRRFLNRQEVEEFEAEVHLKLIDDDYAVLRRFEGRSTLATYLVTVIQRAFLDYQVKRWGKWRPSSSARHHGPLAVELERLVCHEGQTFDGACATLSSSRGHAVDREQMSKLLEKLPGRPSKRGAGPEMLLEIPARGGEPETSLREGERQETARRAEKLLGEALERLSPEDRLLVKLAYVDGLTVAKIATTLGLNQRRLYRTMERSLSAMRAFLEGRGLEKSRVADLLGAPEIFIEVAGLKGEGLESLDSCPSHPSGLDARGTNRGGGVS